MRFRPGFQRPANAGIKLGQKQAFRSVAQALIDRMGEEAEGYFADLQSKLSASQRLKLWNILAHLELPGSVVPKLTAEQPQPENVPASTEDAAKLKAVLQSGQANGTQSGATGSPR